MKHFTNKLKCLGVLGALFLCGVAHANILRDQYLIFASSQSALTSVGVIPSPQPGFDTTDFVNQGSSVVYFRANKTDYLSAQAVVSSVTYVAQTFNDGTAATGTMTVNTFTALSSATATGKLTVVLDSALANQCVSGGAIGLGAFTVCNPKNFAVTGTTTTDIPALVAAINSFNIIQATWSATTPTIIYTTAPVYGAAYNAFQINASTNALTVTQMAGGQNNQSVSINGLTLVANTNFFPATSNNATATSLGTAIVNSSVTTGVTASVASAVLTLTSTAVGTQTNYGLSTSSYSALSLTTLISSSVVTSIGTGTMTGGTNSAFTINSATLTLSAGANYDTTGLAILYNQGASPAIGGLTNQTTYYIVDLNTPNLFQLATTPTNALLGTGIVFTSSQTKTTTDSYTLTPLPITGTPAYSWVVSDDQITWSPWTTTMYGQTIPSVSVGTFNSTGTVTTWDLGHVDYGWVGLQVTPPTTGAINLKIKTIGKGD